MIQQGVGLRSVAHPRASPIYRSYLLIVFAGPPRYGGDFRSWRGIAPRLQTPQRGKLPSENSPPVRGGFCDFGGVSGGTTKITKSLDCPPRRGGVQYCSGGTGPPQAENFGGVRSTKPSKMYYFSSKNCTKGVKSGKFFRLRR